MGDATVRVADVLHAALDILSDEDYARLAARIDAIAETPPEPAKVWTVDDARALCTRTKWHKEAIERARTALDDALFEAYRDLDPTARAATEGALNVACAKLAALVGGARG